MQEKNIKHRFLVASEQQQQTKLNKTKEGERRKGERKEEKTKEK